MTVDLQLPVNAAALSGLRRRWLGVTAVWLAAWLVGYALLRPVWPYANRWLLLSGLALGFGLWALWDGLHQNHRQGEGVLLPTLGVGNQATLVRGLGLGLLSGFLLAPWPMRGLGWWLVLLYTTVSLADYWDGYLARVNNHATLLGARLDMEFDGLGMLVVTLLAVSFGQLPWWYLGLGLARYAFVVGLWWREKRRLPVYDIHPSAHRRIFAGFQMGFMSVVLWPIVPASAATVAGVMFALPTAVGFLRDWWVATGHIQAANPAYRQLRQTAYQLLARQLPPLARLLLLLLVGLIYGAMPNWFQPANWVTLFTTWRLPFPSIMASLMAVVGILSTLLLFLGVFPRFSALLLVFPIGFQIATVGLGVVNGVAMAIVVYLMQFGPGLFALWPVEEPYIVRRLGGGIQ